MNFTIPNYRSSSSLSSVDQAQESMINTNGENRRFIDYVECKVQPIFYALLNTDELDVDVMTPAEEILRDLLAKNFSATINWFNSFLVSNYGSDKIVVNLLKIIGNLEEFIAKDFAIVIALSGFSHQNIEIREMSVRAFENWGSIDSLTMLQKQSLAPAWLEEYRLEVIRNIEEELCLS